MKKLKKDIHAKQRFAERCGIKYSTKLKKYLIRQIQSSKANFLKRTSNSRTVWLARAFDGRKYKVVYSKITKNIITVLPYKEIKK